MYKFYPNLLLLVLNLQFVQLDRCEWIKDNQFLDYCHGVYPQEVAIKYHDNWIKVGEPFVLYRSNKTQTEYIVAFKHSQLHQCKMIEILSGSNFNCARHSQKDYKLHPIYIRHVIGACFPMNLYITDDLLRICLRQNKRREKFKKSSKSILHYKVEEGLTSGGCGGAASVGLVIIGNWILSIYHIYKA